MLSAISEGYQRLLRLEVQRRMQGLFPPNAAKTNITVTMNGRELRHFFNLRCCVRTQWEIREVAIEMLKHVKTVAPAIFENARPYCVEFSYCLEGKLKPKTCNIEGIKENLGNFNLHR